MRDPATIAILEKAFLLGDNLRTAKARIAELEAENKRLREEARRRQRLEDVRTEHDAQAARIAELQAARIAELEGFIRARPTP